MSKKKKSSSKLGKNWSNWERYLPSMGNSKTKKTRKNNKTTNRKEEKDMEQKPGAVNQVVNNNLFSNITINVDGDTWKPLAVILVGVLFGLNWTEILQLILKLF